MPSPPRTKDELRAEVRANLAALENLEARAVRYNQLKTEQRSQDRLFFWTLLMDIAAVLLPEAGLAGRVVYRVLGRIEQREQMKGRLE